MAQLLINPQHQFFDSNGDPLSGGKVYFFEAGTSTPTDTFTDQGGGTPNSNPVILDANGRAEIWTDLAQSYKVRLDDADDNQIWEVDNITYLPDGSITTAKLDDLAVTSAKIADLAVSTAKIANLGVTTPKLANLSVTPGKQAARNYASGGPDSSNPTAFPPEDIAALDCEITTNGRPVLLFLTGQILFTATSAFDGTVALKRGGSTIESVKVPSGSAYTFPGAHMLFIDVPAAGTYTYGIQINRQSYTCNLDGVTLWAVEL